MSVGVIFVLLLAAGWPVAARLVRGAGLSPLMTPATAWLVGQSILALAAFLSVALFGSWSSLSLVVCAVLISGAALRITPHVAAPSAGFGREHLPLLGILPAWIAVALRQVREPVWSNDAIAIWVLKARHLAASRGATGWLDDPGLDFSHPEYPLLWPLTMAVSAPGGRVDEWAVSLLAPLLTLVLVLALAGCWADLGLSAWWQVPLAWVLLSFDSLFGGFSVGLAELPLTLAIVIAATALERASDERSPAAATILSIALLVAVLTKNEGLGVVAAAGATLILLKRPVLRAHGLRIFGPTLVAIGWAMATAGERPVHGDLALRWLEPTEFSRRLLQILEAAASDWFGSNPVPALIFIGLIGLGWRRAPRSSLFAALIGASYLPAWIFTRHDLDWHLETTFERVSAPLGVLLLVTAAAGIAAWLKLDAPGGSGQTPSADR